MFLSELNYGYSSPLHVNAIIEIQKDAGNIKYEVDKITHNLKVDRFLHLPIVYPCSYGYIPNTLSEDGDPLDVLVVTNYKLLENVLLKVKPLFTIKMTDEAGQDDKIIAIPSLEKNISNIKAILEKIEFFFTTYKIKDKNRWVKFNGFGTKKNAENLIIQSIKRNILHKACNSFFTKI